MSTAPPSLDTMLRRFFSIPNRLDLDQIERTEENLGVGRFRRWIAPLRLPEPQATLLPCQREPRGPVDWYAVAFDDREMRTLGEELTAFAGPSYSLFRGERARLDPSDPVEAAVLDISEGRAFRVTAPPGKEPQTGLWQALQRMRDVRSRRQERDPDVLRPAGRILRDFFLSLRAGNRDGAEALLRLLSDRYDFGTWNLIFLRVQMLSDLGRWEELLSLQQMGDLLRIRRPLAVTEALLTAVYHKELEVFEFKDSTEAAAEHFQREVHPRYAPLFTCRTGLRSPAVLKSFLLLAVSQDEPDLELRDEILRTARLPVSEQRYLEALAGLAPEPSPAPGSEDPLVRARVAWAQANYDVAYAQAVSAPPSLERSRILLQCAYEIPALQVRKAAVEAVDDLAQEERDLLLESRWVREWWAEIRGAEDQEPSIGLPSNWIGWLERLQSGWDIDAAVEMAREGADQWEVEGILKEVGGVRRVAEALIDGQSRDTEIAVRNALPHFIASVQRDPEWPRLPLLPLYNALLFLLATTDRGGRDELNLFNEILTGLLVLGMPADQYREVVGWGTEVWDRFPAPRNIDWVLDLLDLLAVYPSPDREARLRLLQSVASSFRQFIAHGLEVQPQQWILFRSRCRELGHAELLDSFPKPEATDTSLAAEERIFEALVGKSVALYTLTESVGQRVASFLRQVCPEVKVEVHDDHVCTERLRSSARNADIFVMATMSAKHAATGCIEGSRPKSLPLLRPAGKGSASMTSALSDFLMQIT